MKIIVEDTYEEVSRTVASLTLSAFYQDRRVNVDLTDGSSPKGAYEIIAAILQKYPERVKNVHFYQHDELDSSDQFVYHLLKNQIHEPFGISKENIHPMDFSKQQEYLEQIEAAGGLDYMLLGIGADAHFCANFPDAAKLDQEIYDYDPKQYSWYDDYRRNFGMEEIPRIATFGFPAVLKAKQVVVVVNGKGKAQAVKDMFTKEISPKYPATILRTHPNLILVMDKEAASLL